MIMNLHICSTCEEKWSKPTLSLSHEMTDITSNRARRDSSGLQSGAAGADDAVRLIVSFRATQEDSVSVH